MHRKSLVALLGNFLQRRGLNFPAATHDRTDRDPRVQQVLCLLKDESIRTRRVQTDESDEPVQDIAL